MANQGLGSIRQSVGVSNKNQKLFSEAQVLLRKINKEDKGPDKRVSHETLNEFKIFVVKCSESAKSKFARVLENSNNFTVETRNDLLQAINQPKMRVVIAGPSHSVGEMPKQIQDSGAEKELRSKTTKGSQEQSKANVEQNRRVELQSSVEGISNVNKCAFHAVDPHVTIKEIREFVRTQVDSKMVSENDCQQLKNNEYLSDSWIYAFAEYKGCSAIVMHLDESARKLGGLEQYEVELSNDKGPKVHIHHTMLRGEVPHWEHIGVDL